MVIFYFVGTPTKQQVLLMSLWHLLYSFLSINLPRSRPFNLFYHNLEKSHGKYLGNPFNLNLIINFIISQAFPSYIISKSIPAMNTLSLILQYQTSQSKLKIYTRTFELLYFFFYKISNKISLPLNN